MGVMSTQDKGVAERLATPVQFLKGVGPDRAELLARLGVRTVRDLIFLFPRDYQDLTDVRLIRDLEPGRLVSVIGKVVDVDAKSLGWGRTMVVVLVHQGSDALRGVWFNQPFMRNKFALGQEVMFSGKAKRHDELWEMAHPRVAWLEEDESAGAGGVLPLYPLTEGLKQWHLRRLVRAALEAHGDLLEEVFPESFLESHALLPIGRALAEIHFPANKPRLEQARRRFIYQELFVLQLALALRHRIRQDRAGAPVLERTAKIDARIRRLFPFPLTAAQNAAIDEIARDLARSFPMNRLLQGDVGSGKTVVAVYAMLLAVAHGYQTVLMAPTEILARQHAATLERLLSASHVRRVLLTSALGTRRKETLEKIADGQIDLVVGTQAVVQDDVRFARLGLVVIDEQHKFSVVQRAALKRSALDPHYLVMTATPIPRTVTIANFGDLDVSTLRESPPGRQPVRTYLATPEQREKWWTFFRRKLTEGRQGYVVTPLVDDSDEIAAASLEATFEELANGPLEAFRLDLVHGRMEAAEKDRAMDAFRRGQTQVLVSTTVIEVGVDVPNATLMTIEGGERYGLAQLHQLRGRISRGTAAGFCCVFANPQTDEARQRLEAFVSTNDGFQLAEVDLALRGPGEFFGTRQHGMSPFRVADLLQDAAVLEEARADALQMVESDPGLSLPQHVRLRRMVLARYGKALDLGDVG